jgi:hypothetical protein
VSPGSGKGGQEVEATIWFRTWFSIDPQPASISPTIKISIVFILLSLLIVTGLFAVRQSKTILARDWRLSFQSFPLENDSSAIMSNAATANSARGLVDQRDLQIFQILLAWSRLF